MLVIHPARNGNLGKTNKIAKTPVSVSTRCLGSIARFQTMLPSICRDIVQTAKRFRMYGHPSRLCELYGSTQDGHRAARQAGNQPDELEKAIAC